MASGPPPSADTQPASVPVTPGKFHTILCTSVHLEGATAVCLPPSGGPVYCEGVARWRLPPLARWRLTALQPAGLTPWVRCPRTFVALA